MDNNDEEFLKKLDAMVIGYISRRNYNETTKILLGEANLGNSDEVYFLNDRPFGMSLEETVLKTQSAPNELRLFFKEFGQSLKEVHRQYSSEVDKFSPAPKDKHIMPAKHISPTKPAPISMNFQPIQGPTEIITDCVPITSSVTVSSVSESSSDGDSTNNNNGSDMLKTIVEKEKLTDKNFKTPKRKNSSTTTPLMGSMKTPQADERKEVNLPSAQEKNDKEKKRKSKNISSDAKRKSKGVKTGKDDPQMRFLTASKALASTKIRLPMDKTKTQLAFNQYARQQRQKERSGGENDVQENNPLSFKQIDLLIGGFPFTAF